MEGDQGSQMSDEIEIIGRFLDPNPVAFLLTLRVKRLLSNSMHFTRIHTNPYNPCFLKCQDMTQFLNS